MEYAHYTIGLHKTEGGEPLVVVGGKIFGTVSEVKETLDKFDGLSVLGINLQTHTADVTRVYDPRKPATVGDIRQAIADYDKSKRRSTEGGGGHLYR